MRRIKDKRKRKKEKGKRIKVGGVEIGLGASSCLVVGRSYRV
jgi:hypothetical protein